MQNYEQMSVSELRQLANEHKIPIPAGVKVMRGVASDPYAEQGRRDLIAELKSMDARSRERRQDLLAVLTLIAAVTSVVLSGVAIILSND